MECMEARALKSSFFSELAMKSTNPQAFSDDFWCVTGLPGEDFSIDEFFDLPNEENKDGSFNLEEEEEEEEEKDSSSPDPIDDNHSNSPNFSPDLAIPVDDLQELELWSHLMDDSVPEAAIACPKPIIDAQNKRKPGFCPQSRVEPGRKRVHGGVPFIPTAVPVRPRSKRPRTAWKTDSSSSSSSSSTVSTPFFTNPIHNMRVVFAFGEPAMKRPKKKLSGGESGGAAVQRRCTHCQVTKTPQWRAGPNGPKTLCNACGVRFKSGRLFPEYRPACSPTFSSEVHSNSHRKVLEMRRRKEMAESETGSTLTTVESQSS